MAIITGADSDGADRTITFGHSTLKTIVGIDDSNDAFIINTDAAFDATLANNSLTIDTNHNITIAGDITIAGSIAQGSDASGDMYYRNAGGVLTRIAVGGDNDVMTLDGAVPGWEAASGGGTDRFTISNRFRAGALANTARVYFTDDVDTSGNQFYVATKYATHGATIAIDSDWLSGFEGGPQWQAPRACTLTQIAATSRINANASCHSVRVSVWKATPVNNNTWSTDITWTEIGTADLTNDGATTLTDYELQTVNTAISSGNSISAADCVIIGFQPIGGTTAATSYFQVTLEFTVS